MKKSPLMRDDPGTYLLVMQCADSQTVKAGAQGTVTLHTGVYLYAGSAFGPGGVGARVRRHARIDHAQHWHIDYIRPHCALRGAWVSYADTKLECPWACALLDADGTSVPKKGLGSSDCGCRAHFMRWETERNAPHRAVHRPHRAVHRQIEALLQDARPDATPVWVEKSQII